MQVPLVVVVSEIWGRQGTGIWRAEVGSRGRANRTGRRKAPPPGTSSVRSLTAESCDKNIGKQGEEEREHGEPSHAAAGTASRAGHARGPAAHQHRLGYNPFLTTPQL